MDRTCGKCGAVFDQPYLLKRHQSRKTPCEPVIYPEASADSHKTKCKTCGRTFATRQSLSRHRLAACPASRNEEDLRQQVAKQAAELERMAALLDKLVLDPQSLQTHTETGGTRTMIHNYGAVATGPITVNNVKNVNNVIVMIRPFDNKAPLLLPVSAVVEAFTENQKLAEYCGLSDDDKTDADKARPYVLEALVDLVKRAHQSPESRNVHLNPQRADQVMVRIRDETAARPEEGATPDIHRQWEVRPLSDIVQLLFDGIAAELQHMILSNSDRSQLPFAVQSAASWVPSLYKCDREHYVHAGKGPIAAHLRNTMPVDFK